MCRDCGCGLPGEDSVGINAGGHEHSHEKGAEGGSAHGHAHEHAHGHEPGDHSGQEHDHPHTHPHAHPGSAVLSLPATTAMPEADQTDRHRLVEVRRSILDKNDRLAERNRGFFEAHGLLVINVLSSPGSGKTTLLAETLRTLDQSLKAGVIVGDLATDNDAQRLRQSGAPVVQITTGTVCHLDAEMVSRAARELDLHPLQLLVIENVGNLVCPASYDLGEKLRVVLLSVTEGEDKPLKYPPIFQSADVVVITKLDLAQACGYDRELVLANLRKTAPRARVFEVCAKTGYGMEAWREFLSQQHRELR
jgi:hydrogenase nickel incorporation protein HypB